MNKIQRNTTCNVSITLSNVVSPGTICSEGLNHLRYRKIPVISPELIQLRKSFLVRKRKIF